MSREKRYRYVNDHGDIFRMTVARYHRYLLAGTKDKFPNAEDFGVCRGSVLTVNSMTPSEFAEEYNREHGKLLNKILANGCPTCGAAPGAACLSLQKRWENPMSRTVGIGDKGWRKTPHAERVKLARGR